MKEYIFEIDSTSLEESNNNLMKLWGAFLNKGEIGWHYRPIKEALTIWVGAVSVHGFSGYEVKINLKNKRSINNIVFTKQSGESFTDEEKSYFDLINSERKNIQKSIYIFRFKINIESTKGIKYIYPFIYKDFAMFCIDKDQFIEFNVEGYCKDQTSETALEKIYHICDILSIQTNSIFTIKKSYVIRNNIKLSEDVEEKNQIDEEWIDDYPIEDSHFILPQYAKEYIYENIIKAEEYSSPIIKASRHFSNGLLIISGNRSEFMELFTSQMMSCLEVLSECRKYDKEVCSSCGQVKYSIRQRVLSLIEDELSSSPYMKKKFDQYYIIRSKYLHSGELTSRRKYQGVSLPKINDKSPDGCEVYHIIEDINLIEWISYIARNIMQRQKLDSKITADIKNNK